MGRRKLYKDSDYKREREKYRDLGLTPEPYRSEFRRDYARLIHSPAFRRLQGKTQLFPGIESDFFRNRLTHSIEVAQIAKSIAIRLNNTEKDLKGTPIDLDLVEFAGLAHDLGHPPFGHNGEAILNKLMNKHGGFEGNAQTLRIISKIEKKELVIGNNKVSYPNSMITAEGVDKRIGLNLTYRTIASTLKYDNTIHPVIDDDRLIKGYYKSEKNLVKRIKNSVLGGRKQVDNFKTVECSIMDIADDIAYSTYDLEDALKAGFITPIGIFSAEDKLLNKVACVVSSKLGIRLTKTDVIKTILEIFVEEKVFDIESLEISPTEFDINNPYDIAELIVVISNSSQNLANHGYYRTTLTSDLVGKAIRNVTFEYNSRYPELSKVSLDPNYLRRIEVLKHYIYCSLIESS